LRLDNARWEGARQSTDAGPETIYNFAPSGTNADALVL
jgi:hypothetical protein